MPKDSREQTIGALARELLEQPMPMELIVVKCGTYVHNEGGGVFLHDGNVVRHGPQVVGTKFIINALRQELDRIV